MDTLFLTVLVLLLTFPDSLAISVVERYPNHGSHNSHCTSFPAYNRLHDLIDNDECLSVDKVFQDLADISSFTDFPCRVDVIKKLGERYPRGTKMPAKCQCSGPHELHNYDTNKGNYYRVCRSGGSYLSIYDTFYRDNGNVAPACRTHHSLWYELASVPSGGFCQKDLVVHLAATFKAHPDPCTCSTRHVAPTSHPTDGHTNLAHATHPTQLTIPARCNTNPNVILLNNLMAIKTRPCLSIHTLWSKLEQIQQTDPDCMGIIDQLAHTFPINQPHYCLCEGSVEKVHNPFLSTGHRAELAQCFRLKTYKLLEQFLFEDTTGNACLDHKWVWATLSKLKSSDNSNCTADFIKTAARKYTNIGSDQCTCRKTDYAITFATKPHTTASTKATVTTTTTKKPTPTTIKPTPTTTKASTTTPHSIHTYSCKKFQTVDAIANHIVVNSTNATRCRGSGSNEGYVLTECNVTSIDQWHKGRKVWPGCDDIPWYTPVAVFTIKNSNYHSNHGLSGIFAGCLTNGFRLIVEHCTGYPTIVHINTGGHHLEDPNQYYLID